jgi:hypothetical protein
MLSESTNLHGDSNHVGGDLADGLPGQAPRSDTPPATRTRSNSDPSPERTIETANNVHYHTLSSVDKLKAEAAKEGETSVGKAKKSRFARCARIFKPWKWKIKKKSKKKGDKVSVKEGEAGAGTSGSTDSVTEASSQNDVQLVSAAVAAAAAAVSEENMEKLCGKTESSDIGSNGNVIPIGPEPLSATGEKTQFSHLLPAIDEHTIPECHPNEQDRSLQQDSVNVGAKGGDPNSAQQQNVAGTPPRHNLKSYSSSAPAPPPYSTSSHSSGSIPVTPDSSVPNSLIINRQSQILAAQCGLVAQMAAMQRANSTDRTSSGTGATTPNSSYAGTPTASLGVAAAAVSSGMMSPTVGPPLTTYTSSPAVDNQPHYRSMGPPPPIHPKPLIRAASVPNEHGSGEISSPSSIISHFNNPPSSSSTVPNVQPQPKPFVLPRPPSLSPSPIGLVSGESNLRPSMFNMALNGATTSTGTTANMNGGGGTMTSPSGGISSAFRPYTNSGMGDHHGVMVNGAGGMVKSPSMPGGDMPGRLSSEITSRMATELSNRIGTDMSPGSLPGQSPSSNYPPHSRFSFSPTPLVGAPHGRPGGIQVSPMIRQTLNG